MNSFLDKMLSPIDKLLAMTPEWLINLAMRLMIFKIFWFSVQTKITGMTVAGQHFAFWNLTSNTFLLFDYEYNLPLIASDVAAYLATFGEFFLAIMILVGVMTRFAAVGLLIMTMTIQFFVYPEAWWTVHVYWTLLLLYIVRHGGGVVSVDHALFKRS